jgi:hypothetical protein
MRRLRERLGAEDGVAMIVAMGVLASMLVLTATVLSSATLLGKTTGTDQSRKRAFEAAEAGLQATVYRLNMLAPAADKCIGGTGETVQAPTGAIAERCVISTGTVGGVSRRVETRVASYAAAPLFPVAGVVGLHSVSISNNGHVVGGTGSNGQVTIGNNGGTTTTTLGPSAPNPSVGNNGSAGAVTRRTALQGPFSFAPVDPGNSATVSDDVRISNAFANPRVSPFDSVGSGVTWNAATRTLALGNNASLTLGGAIYNFCNLSLSNNSTITLAAGARTAIFVDSPERSGSGCPATSGTVSMSNNSSFVNNSPPVAGSGFAHDPTALQLYVVGKTGATVSIANNAAFYGTVYAPTSTLSVANNGGTWGAIAANDIQLANNGTLTGDPNATNITTNAGGVYFRTAWRECLASATTSDPASGC